MRRRHDQEPARRQPAPAGSQTLAAGAGHSDPQLARAREAGGPVDRAAYGCACGFQFSAPVSTTVSCPHCGGEQAW